MTDTVEVSGEVDIATVPELRMRLETAIEGNPGACIEVDFSRVTFVDSSGLGVLIGAQRRARAGGGDVVVTNLKSSLRTVFDLTGLDKMLLASAEAV